MSTRATSRAVLAVVNRSEACTQPPFARRQVWFRCWRARGEGWLEARRRRRQVLQPRAVERGRPPGAAGVDEQQVVVAQQPAVHRREVARGAGRGVAGPALHGDQGADRPSSARHPAEPDPDPRRRRVGVVQGHPDRPAPGRVAGAQVAATEVRVPHDDPVGRRRRLLRRPGARRTDQTGGHDCRGHHARGCCRPPPSHVCIVSPWTAERQRRGEGMMGAGRALYG